MDDGRTSAQWQDDLYDLLRRHDVTQFAYVPDAGHRVLIARALADPRVRAVALTAEEAGVDSPAYKCNLDPAFCRNRFRSHLLGAG